jgi:hypothetical protein
LPAWPTIAACKLLCATSRLLANTLRGVGQVTSRQQLPTKDMPGLPDSGRVWKAGSGELGRETLASAAADVTRMSASFDVLSLRS